MSPCVDPVILGAYAEFTVYIHIVIYTVVWVVGWLSFKANKPQKMKPAAQFL